MLPHDGLLSFHDDSGFILQLLQQASLDFHDLWLILRLDFVVFSRASGSFFFSLSL